MELGLVLVFDELLYFNVCNILCLFMGLICGSFLLSENLKIQVKKMINKKSLKVQDYGMVGGNVV